MRGCTTAIVTTVSQDRGDGSTGFLLHAELTAGTDAIAFYRLTLA
jgi:hypothetical protein